MTRICEEWSLEDMEELDAKFDALCEFLGIEFVYEKISDGSDSADRHTWHARKKSIRPTVAPDWKEIGAEHLKNLKTASFIYPADCKACAWFQEVHEHDHNRKTSENHLPGGGWVLSIE